MIPIVFFFFFPFFFKKKRKKYKNIINKKAFALSVLTAIILCFCWRRSRTRSRRFKGKGNQKYSKLGNDFEMDRFEDVTVFSVDDK
mgnify:CR=1 FL=1